MSICRRRVLELMGLGGLAFALPPLESLVAPRGPTVRAQPPAPQRRLLVCHFANGSITGRPDDSAWTPGVPGGVLDELGPWVDRVAVIDGLSNDAPSLLDDGRRAGGNPHVAPSATVLSCVRPRLSGTEALGSGGITVDQVAARELGAGRVPILVAAGASRRSSPYYRESRISYTGANDGVDPIVDPASIWTYCFEGLDPSDEAAAARTERRRAVLDHLEASAGRLAGALGSADRARVDEHIAALSDLRTRLDRGAAASCSLPPTPGAFDAFTDEKIDVMLDLVTMALACDATRVVTFSLTSGGGGPSFAATSVGRDVQDHDVSHLQNGTTLDDHRAVTAWKVQRFARLLERLDRVTDVDGSTLLDNTTVVFVSEISHGGGHGLARIPVVVAGPLLDSARGATLVHRDAPLARLWLAALRSVGVGADAVPDFGNAGGEPLPDVWSAA